MKKLTADATQQETLEAEVFGGFFPLHNILVGEQNPYIGIALLC